MIFFRHTRKQLRWLRRPGGLSVRLGLGAVACMLSVQVVAAQEISVVFEVLKTLYDVTDGDNWNNNANWDTTRVPTAAELSTWHGVTYTDGSLTQFFLVNNNLTGPIPPELGKLTDLKHVCLDSNALSGSIPSELGDLVNLETLTASTNALSDPIPSSLGNLANLKVLSLGGNSLSDPIPSELGKLANLKFLFLSANELSGSIPSSLGNLENLIILSLTDNSLSDPIPSSLGNLTNLRELYIAHNSLSGSIPSSLGNLTEFRRLDLSHNKFTNPLPMSMTQLGFMYDFDWHDNNGLCAPLDTDFQDWLAEVERRGWARGPNCTAQQAATLSVHGESVSESASEAVVSARLTPSSTEEVRVHVSTADGTATAGSDYTAGASDLVFAPGETEKSIRIAILDDALVEGDETFQVQLSGAQNADISRGAATVTIVDDDFTEVSIDDVVVAEDEGRAVFTVRVSAPSTGPVTVPYTSVNGTATAGADYVPVSEELVILPGELSGQVEVVVIDDERFEEDETFTVVLNNAAGAVLGDHTGEGTIRDNDRYGLRVDDVTVGEADGGVRFTVSLDRPNPVQIVRVTYATANGTATAGLDYEARSGTLEFSSGVVSRTVRVPITDDTEWEDSETLSLVLSAPRNAEIADRVGVGTIVDDDAVYLRIADVRAEEGSEHMVFAVRLNRPSPVAVSAFYETRGASALEGVDYVRMAGSVRFAPGETEQTIVVSLLDDALDEPDETFQVLLSGVEHAEVAVPEATGTIVDDDRTPVLDVVQGVRVFEGAGSALFAVTLSAPSAYEVTAVYATVDGTAQAGSDYEGVSGTLRIAPGETAGMLRVSIVDDAVREPEETFTLVLSGVQHADLGAGTSTGTIVDDEAPLHMRIDDVTVGEDAGSAVFTVRLSGQSAMAVRANYATTDETATVGADYTETSGALHFAPGEVEKRIVVPVLEDDVDEPDETFLVRLSGAVGAEIAGGAGRGTITDNDELLTVSIYDGRASEDAGLLVLPVRLSRTSLRVVRVLYATLDETAEAGADYTETSGRVEFAPGEVEKGIVVSVLEDDVDEPDETFLVRLSGAVNAEIVEGTGRGTITDNDEPLTISIYDGRATEDAGLLHLPVRLSRTSSRVVSVFFESSDLTAEAGLDYAASRGIVVFERGSTEGVVAITVEEDALDEDHETFQVTLSRPTNAVIARGVATGTIGDNDGMPHLRMDDILVREDGEAAVFTVRLSMPSTRLVTVGYRTVDGTATAGADYEETSGTLTFAPGTMQKEVDVRLMRGERDWREETFTLALASASNALLEDAVALATIVEEEPIETGVLVAYLARFARTSAGHVTEALGERLREVAPVCAPVAGAGLQLVRYANPHWNPSAGELLAGCGLLTRSSVGGGAFSVWGRGAFTRWGGRESALSLRADVTTASFGADYRWRSGLLAGLVLAYSDGAGTFEAYAADGKTGARLTGVYPYVSYRLWSSDIWVLVGLGRGTAEVEGAKRVEAELAASLVAAGATGTLVQGGTARLSYEADAFVVRVDAEEARRILVSRLRAGLEGSVLMGRTVRPYVEVALRGDGGDAETGLGLEMGGGVRLAHPGSILRAAVGARGLVTHASAGFTEWGVAATLRYGAAGGLGPTAELRPVWGAGQSGGMQALWRHPSVAQAAISASGQQRVELLLGYGVAHPTGVARPVFAVTMREGGREYRLGYEVRLQNGLALSASGTARGHVAEPVVYGISSHATLRW